MALFQFDLTAEDERRNTELLNSYKGYNKVILGNIVLAVKNIEPRKVSFQVDNKGWFTPKDAGIDTETSRKVIINKDGTKSEIVTSSKTLDDGTVITTTTENILSTAIKETSTTSTTNIPLVQPGTAGIGKANSPWGDKLLRRVTTTTRQPQGTTKRYVTVTTEDDPENPKSRYVRTDKFTDEQYEVQKAQPVVFRSITGAETTQYIDPAPPQGQDETYWNQDMFNTSEEVLTEAIDNEDGTRTTVTTTNTRNADNLLKTVIETKTEDIEPEETDNTKLTVTTTTPVSESIEEIIYDLDGNERSKKKTTTTNYDTINGGDPVSVTILIETTTDDLGKIVQKTSTTRLNNATGQEDVEEVEEILNPGADKVTYNRSIQRDLTAGIERVSETVERTTGLGITTTEAREYTRGTAKVVTSSEQNKEFNVDKIVDDLVNGFIVTEYVISGDLMTMPQIHKIKNKYTEHQLAWGFLKVREEQLNLGNRLSPAKRRQLFKEWQECFYGEPNSTVLGGPTLDRIELYAMGEHSIPVVFSSSSDAFKVDYIPGAYGLYSWSMVVQSYKRIVRDKDNTYHQDMAGGYYGRSDADHWLGGAITDDLSTEITNRQDLGKGGSWPYN